jgi:uncharacterized membrane protein
VRPAPVQPIRLSRASQGLVAACVALAISAVHSAPALADLKLCNTTPNRVGVAIGYRNPGGGLTSEGWWTLPGQTCETLYKGPLPSRFWYVYAVDYDGGGEWAGNASLCTIDKAFTIKTSSDCAKQGYNATGFFEVDVNQSTDWTIRLTDPSEGGAKAK